MVAAILAVCTAPRYGITATAVISRGLVVIAAM